MTAYTNTRDNSVLPGAGYKDGDTLTTVNGSKWIYQNEAWFPVAFGGSPAIHPLTVQTSLSGEIGKISIGQKSYERWREIDGRHRIGTASALGTTSPDESWSFEPDGSKSYTAAVVGAATYKNVLVDLPTGKRAIALRCNVGYQFNAGGFDQCYFEFPISRKFNPSDVILVDMYVPGDGVHVQTYLTKNNMVGYLRWDSYRWGGTTITASASRGLVTVAIPVGRMTQGGTTPPTIADVMTKMRIAVWGSSCRTDVAYLLGWRINSKAQSMVCFESDDGFLSSAWYADQLGAVGAKLTANIVASRLLAPPEGYMGVNDARNLLARGNVEFTSHSNTHMYVNGAVGGVLYGSSLTAISSSKALADGPITLDGPIPTASAGVFDKPRHVTFTHTGSSLGVIATVVGKLDGANITESLSLGAGGTYPVPTENTFDYITSVTIAAGGRTLSGTISVGVSMSYDEIEFDLMNSVKILDGLGFLKAWHYTNPQGNWNNSLREVLRKNGFLSARQTEQALIPMVTPQNWHALPAMIFDSTTYSTTGLHAQVAVDTGQSVIFYTHDIQATSGANTSSFTQIQQGLSDLSPMIRSGALKPVTRDEMCRLTDAVWIP